MEPELKGLEPGLLWRHFDALRQIPRCSGDEAAAARYVISIAQRNGLEYEQDEAGNVVIRKPAPAGRETASAVVLQSHLDMVCEKDAGVVHDFGRDGLQLALEDGWLTAVGTTLGADNGIGAAAALAVLEDADLIHGPIECLFTVDEERGLHGAIALRPDFIAGHTLLNLDADQFGTLFVGCAGGGDSIVTLPVRRRDAVGVALQVAVSGLVGGHSGIDIDKGRGNAIRILAQLLYRLHQELPLALAQVEGGSKRNAIPREANATLFVAAGDEGRAHELLNRAFAGVASAYKESEQEIALQVTTGRAQDAGKTVITDDSLTRAFELLLGFPTGVIAVSREMPGLVETSNNLAVVSLQDTDLRIELSSRSAQPQALDDLLLRIKALAEAAGATVVQPAGYPGWTPDFNSPLLQLVMDVYKRIFGDRPEVHAVHAGVEPAVFGKKKPGLQMISIGPTLAQPHSPQERVKIASVAQFWRLLTATLEALA